MGFFSWNTADTGESIPNNASGRDTFTVYVLTPDGTKYVEDNYEGYGVFGGKDVYQLVAELNCPEECNGGVEHDRSIGIDIACYDRQNESLAFPIKIVRNGDLTYEEVGPSTSCEDQGFFYDDEEEDDCCYYCGYSVEDCCCDDDIEEEW